MERDKSEPERWGVCAGVGFWVGEGSGTARVWGTWLRGGGGVGKQQKAPDKRWALHFVFHAHFSHRNSQPSTIILCRRRP